MDMDKVRLEREIRHHGGDIDHLYQLVTDGAKRIDSLVNELATCADADDVRLERVESRLGDVERRLTEILQRLP